MEEDQRKQKLRAGKEKLAQFQKKKKKKKRSNDETSQKLSDAVQIGGNDVNVTSPSELSSGARFVYDSDQQSLSSYSEDDAIAEDMTSKAYVAVKSRLAEKTTRVEELEESLVGKQLALDKVIQENEKLRKQATEVVAQKSADANANLVQNADNVRSHTENQSHSESGNRFPENQSAESGTTSANAANGAGHQALDVADIQELFRHVQWLQMQLKQASGTLNAQTEKQRKTVGALQQAKDEIIVLQDNIMKKDEVVSELAEKLTHISTEYGSLKQGYAEITRNRNIDIGNATDLAELENEMTGLKENVELGKNELEKVKTEKESEIEELKCNYEQSLVKVSEEANAKVDAIESENVILKSENDALKEQNSEILSENDNLTLGNETLIKALEILKKQHEASISDVQDLTLTTENLKKENDKFVNENSDYRSELESLKSEKDANNLEMKRLDEQIISLQNEKQDMDKQMKEIQENLEKVEHEYGSVTNENTTLSDEIAQVKDENSLYQSQIAEYEDNISQSDDVLQENHLLRVQNDELYNKINNQKDIIASLKSEVEVVSNENGQHVGQLKELAKTVEQFKDETSSWQEERDTIKVELKELQSMLELSQSENMQYQVTNLSLSNEIQELKQELINSNLECETHRQKLLTQQDGTIVVDKVTFDDEFPCKYNEEFKPVEEMVCVQETIVPDIIEENLSSECFQTYQYASSISTSNDANDPGEIVTEPELFENATASYELQGDGHNLVGFNVSDLAQDLSTITEHCDLVNTNVNANHVECGGNVPSQENDKIVKSSSAKENSENEKDATISKLKRELEVLKSELHQLQAANIVSKITDGAKQTLVREADEYKLMPSDQPESQNDDTQLSSYSDKTTATAEDTAYHSFGNDSQLSKQSESNESNESETIDLRERLETLQLEFDNVSETLKYKIEECENLKIEVETLKISSVQKPADNGSTTIHSSNSTQEHASKDNLRSGDVTGFHEDHAKEVSELDPPKVEALEMEVNMHASSTPIHHGLLDHSVGETSVHSYFGGVDNDNDLQTLDTEADDGQNPHGLQENLLLGEVQPPVDTVTYDSDEELSRNCKEILYLKEIAEQCKKEKEDLMDLLQSEKDEKVKILDELEQVEKMNTKSMKEAENQNNVVKQLQNKMDHLNTLLEESEKSNCEQKQEIEKLCWERNELVLRTNYLDMDNMDMQNATSNSKYREDEIREELSRVKERLEYFESSESDFFEMKETLEKIQEEKENILKENEKLQGSLSAHIEENERIFETMEALHKENAEVLQNMRDSNTEISTLKKELKLHKTKIENHERKLADTLKKKENEETRYMSEIDGLLQENSTLKTKVQSTDTEIEILQVEIERLNSFFPNIDEQTEENNVLKRQYLELEAKYEEHSKENENLVSELMEIQQKLGEGTDENELLLDKCDEFQRIVADMDDEKTSLLEIIKNIKGNADEEMKEKDCVIAKFEMQLGGLDEENATLKTQVLSLKQDLQDVLDQTQSIDDNLSNKLKVIDELEKEKESLSEENAEYKNKINILEQDLMGLVEQIQLFDDTLTEKADLATRLEKQLKELLEENVRVTAQCSSLDHDLNELQEREKYLKEQLKVYENNMSSGKNNELDTLRSQLELELRYKTKLQNDLETVLTEQNNVVQENRKLRDETDNLHKDLEILNKAKQEDNVKITEMDENLKIFRIEKDKTLEELKNTNEENKAYAKENEFLKTEKETLQAHLYAVSENRNHIRHQVEILAAEMENLGNSRDDIVSRYYTTANENKKLKNKTNQFVDKMKLLELENETLNDANKMLKAENEDMRGQFSSIQGKLDKVDDILEKNLDIEGENRTLNNRVEELHIRLNGIQKEKGEYEMLTEELTNMLHDMQSKYEDVKSEMETTKKKCDKEISQLQSQLQVMNDDVGELRKMLDLMENEMYNATEEKTVLKENLEEQQAQYVEAVEQKQKLEEILSEKQQKDMKNMKMVSKLNQKSAQNTSTTSEQDGATSDSAVLNEPSHADAEDVEELVNQSFETLTIDLHVDALGLNPDMSLEQNAHTELHTSSVPTFASAFQFLEQQIRAPDDKLLNISVQTNISVGEFETFGYLLDDNGNTSENVKETNIVSSSTQTELQMNENAIYLDDVVNENCDLDTSFKQSGNETGLLTDDLCSGTNTLYETANETVLDADSIVEMIKDLNETKPELIIEKSDQCVQTNLDVEDSLNKSITDDSDSQTNAVEKICVSCQCELITSVVEKSETVKSKVSNSKSSIEAKDVPYYETENSICDNDEMTEGTDNISVASIESGIYSASANLERPLVSIFRYPVVNADVTETCDVEDTASFKQNKSDTEASDVDEVDNNGECTDYENDDLKVESTHISAEMLKTSKDFKSQTEIELCDEEIAKLIEERILELKAEFERNSSELEDQIKSRITKGFDFREQKVKVLEGNYEKKVKQMEYDIEEKYEQKFRQREVEIVMEAEKDKRGHASQVEEDAKRNIERIKIEKDQEFVEQLQKVRVDLARRHRKESGDVRRTMSHDVIDHRRKDSSGDAGDEHYSQSTGDVWKLQQENKDLEITRDALRHKIKHTQQEQEVLYQSLLSIMGEQDIVGSSQQLTNQETPSWLNWQLAPEFSFDSVTSSIDHKSLSGSLDHSSFCSNSDCLTVRMRYEQLTEKIQQFLKMKSSQSNRDSQSFERENDAEADTKAETVSVEECVPNNAQEDRFVEHTEPDYQTLQRITSIHLEHCVRIPKSLEEQESVEDQFVSESCDMVESLRKSEAENNNNILDQIVRESEIQMEQYEEQNEGHFSENEVDDFNDEIEEFETEQFVNATDLKPDVINNSLFQFSQHRASVSRVEEGHFSEDDNEDDEPNCYQKRKRHYSDSDVGCYVAENSKVLTCQSDNTDGSFVFEKSSFKSGSGDLKSMIYDTIQGDDSSENEIEVFEDIEKASQAGTSGSEPQYKLKSSKERSKRNSMSKKQNLSRLELSDDKFISEHSPMEDRPPGTEELNLKRKENAEPLTGEESGDFFEEKIEREFMVRPNSAKSTHKISKNVSEQYERKNVSYPEGDQGKEERADSGDILDSLIQEIKTSMAPPTVDRFVDETGDHTKEIDTDKIQPVSVPGEFVLEESQEDELFDANASEVINDYKGDENDALTVKDGSDIVVRPETPRKDLIGSSQNLSADFSTVQKPYFQGKQSYENTVFDMLNSICPGTDPTRIPGFGSDSNTIHPALQQLENTNEEFSELPIENEMQNVLEKYNELQNQVKLMSIEKENLEKTLRVKDKELAEKNKMNEGKDELELLVKELKQQVLDNDSKLEGYQKLQSSNEILTLDIEKLKVMVYMFEEKLTETKKLSENKEKMQNDVLEEMRNKNELLTEKLESLEETNTEYTTAVKELSKENNELLDCQDVLSSKQKVIEKRIEDLEEVKFKLISENDSLKDSIQKGVEFKNAQVTLKSEIAKLTNEKDELVNELHKERGNYLHDKDELEKALIAQADMHDKLEQENKVLLEKIHTMQSDEIHKSDLRALQIEIDSLNSKLKEETDVKLQLKLRDKELNEELSVLKIDKNEMNVLISSLKLENEEIRKNFDMKSNELHAVKEEKDAMNLQIKNLKQENETLAACMHAKEEKLTMVACDNAQLSKTIESLRDETANLGMEVQECTERINEYIKENDALKSSQKDLEQFKNKNEELRCKIKEAEELNIENEWAIKELANQVESLEAEKSSVVEQNLVLSEQLCNLTRTESREKVNINLKDEDNLKNENDSSLKQKLEQLNEQLNSENIENQNVIESCRKEVEELKMENISLAQKLETIDEKSESESETDLQILEDMKAAIKSLQDENLSVVKQNEKQSEILVKESQTLQSEIQYLQDEKEQLKKQAKSHEVALKKENTEILKMYNDLRNEVEVLVISKHDLEIELHALKDLLEQEPSPLSPVRVDHDTSRELTLQDLEEMEDLKDSIEKLKNDMKEKDSYVRKLEEHLLNVDRGLPDLTSTPTPKPTASRGEPVVSRTYAKRRPWADYGRRAFSHDITDKDAEIGIPGRMCPSEHDSRVDSSSHSSELDQSTLSEGHFVDGLHVDNLFTSSVQSDTRSLSSVAESFDGAERVKSGLKPEEDGHFALELKQFELVDEIGKLRRDFRETKAIYAQETVLLTKALEREKMQKEMMETHSGTCITRTDSRSGTVQNIAANGNHSQDMTKQRHEVAMLREENKLLKIENERWLNRIKEQEQIVLDLKERLCRNTSGIEEIEEVFGRQLALLQKQREELLDKLRDNDMENVKLSAVLGEKGIVEDSLRREKDILVVKLQEKENIEVELNEKKILLQKLDMKQKEFEEVIHQKDKKEIELMKQTRLLQEELQEIESKFRDREENLGFEKNKLLDELRENKNIRNRSRLSESDDDTRSVCSDNSLSDRNIGRLEIMLEDVEKQHAVAVRTLRDQLQSKYSLRERTMRGEHMAGLSKLKVDTNKQVK